MAGNSTPEPSPQLGWKATVAGLIFALAVLGGFGVATAISTDQDSDHGDEHGEESESHDDDADEHSDEG